MMDAAEPRSLINEDGAEFDEVELEELRAILSELDNPARERFRNRNARDVAQHGAQRLLIVAGPGTGKSYLFLDRIRHWLRVFPGERIRVTTFVRKLVRDLTNDIRTSTLSPAEQQLVGVTTLHGFARSLLERNGGTSELPMRPYVRVITAPWQDTIWGDVLSFHPDAAIASFEEFERQLHDNELSQESPWPSLRRSYFALCRYYNALGFADTIVQAREAVVENPDLLEERLWIIDEFQDFNSAEEALIESATRGAHGVLFAGDDDQTLYQTLKGSHPEIIRGYYRDGVFANAMLAFCGRCGYHIAMAATGFLRQQHEPESIPKIFLPVTADEESEKVHLVVCSAPSTAATYVTDFIEKHRPDLETRRRDIEEGNAKDPFLLILAYQKDLHSFLSEAADSMLQAVEDWRIEEAGAGRDLFVLLTYLRSASEPTDSFSLRKVLVYEGVDDDTVHAWLQAAVPSGIPLADLDDEPVRESLAKCKQVATTVESDLASGDKVEELLRLIPVEDANRFASDLATYLEEDRSLPGEEEEIETAGAISPIELMTMVGAKGLSADHVILLGFDPTNMAQASPQLFFVAMTRARKSLHLLTAIRARGALAPHPFLWDIPEEHCSFSRKTAKETTRFESRADLDAYVERLAAVRRRRGRSP